MANYFLGESTSDGFKTSFGSQILEKGWYTYILKGGAGTGKSTLMKKIAKAFDDSDNVDLYFCSSDPDSLDAVVLNKRRIIVVDGTSPHVFDPYYAGVSQSIVNLGENWDRYELEKNSSEIIKATDDNLELHRRCRRYITALSSINTDIYSIAKNALKDEKLDGFISRFSKKNIPNKKGSVGSVKFRKLSALTPKGYFTHEIPARNIYILNDDNFAGADYFLQKTEELASSKGYDVIISECSLFSRPIYEHLIIPELDTAFVLSDFINKLSAEGRKINFRRFYCNEKIKARKQRLDFSKKAAEEMLSEGTKCLGNAKSVHDVIEEYYINAIDFEKTDSMTSNLINRISEIKT